MKKIISALLILMSILSLCSCGTKNAVISDETVAKTFKLPYSSSDSLNPYTCKSETNRYLSSLIYDSLFKIGNNCMAENCLAKSYVDESRSLTVTLKQRFFSDKSAVTADDVVYSFNLAKNTPFYKDSLKAFSFAESKGSKIVRFTLAYTNEYAANLLTFPILNKKNADVSSGLYEVSKNNDTVYLNFNKQNKDIKPKIDKILLIDCRDYSSAINMLNNGEIDYAFDTLDDGNIRSSTGNSVSGMMNNLIFLGINSKKNPLKKSDFRKGISCAINQESIVSTAFKGYGYATASPFNPKWSDMGSIVSNSTQSKTEEAKTLFINSGYTYDNMDVNLLNGDKRIKLSLIVNSANNMKIEAAEAVKTQLINVGIDVEIKLMPFDEYNVAIENGNFDLYIGEVKINNDFSLDCFFTKNGGATFGINSPKLCSIYSDFRNMNATLQEFVAKFSEDNPFIPICYKGADVCYSANLEGNISANINDIYYNIKDWNY